MPTWGEILTELNKSSTPAGTPDYDRVRRQYLQRLHDLTGRAVILYATAWLESRPIPPAELQVGLPDIQGLMEAVSNLRERDLDLILGCSALSPSCDDAHFCWHAGTENYRKLSRSSLGPYGRKFYKYSCC